MTNEAEKTVLIVDDEPAFTELLARLMEANHFRTVTAKDGNECLERVNEVVPDIILLDVMMPGLSIEELLRALEDDERLSHTKIILLSAVRLPEAEERGLLAGNQVVDFIEKAFPVRRLIDAIERAMR